MSSLMARVGGEVKVRRVSDPEIRKARDGFYKRQYLYKPMPSGLVVLITHAFAFNLEPPPAALCCC